MRRTRTRLLLLACALGALVPPAAAAQEAGETPLVYRREVFRYDRAGRPDPFRSLLTVAELGYRVEDMRLTGIIYSPDARRSVAVLTEAQGNRRFRLRVGERLGGITIAAIHPRQVDVVVNEFGVVRRESLQLKRPQPARGEEEIAAPPPPAPRPHGEAQNRRGT